MNVQQVGSLESLDFEKLNEADIRGEVLEPLLHRLGYRSGTRSNIIREQSLRYPKASLGRKNPAKDPELRGKADYILEVNNLVRWVLEAKAPSVSIGIDEIEQAWTYANHPEVRAVYFALCNGRTLDVYRSAYGPQRRAVLSLAYEAFERDFQILENVVGPEALLRDFRDVEVDVGIPIAPGLRSVARITNGAICYETNDLNIPVLKELQIAIPDGALERDEDGRLVALVNTVGPSRSLQELNERLRLSTFEMISQDNQLSTDPLRPTTFVYNNRVTLPAGEKLLDLSTWREVPLLANISFEVSAEAAGTYSDRVLSGVFTVKMQGLEMRFALSMSGSFKIHLA
jgi:hypothetical protein